MVEATRFPNDFDGYITGDPFFDVPGQTLAGKASLALLASPGAYIPPPLLKLVDNAVYANCDATDGVADNLIQNPGKCSFDPRTLLCEDSNTGNCLPQEQVDTLTRWFSALRDQEGRAVTLGYPVSDLYDNGELGNNLFRWTEAAGPPIDINAPEPWGNSPPAQPPAWSSIDQTLKYFVYLDPNFDTNHNSPVDFRTVVHDYRVYPNQLVDDAALDLIETRLQAGSGDFPRRLAPFLALDRKLIMYHGYSDGWINPFRTIRFFRDWSKLVGRADLKQNARLFMVPGLYHCQRGPGPNTFDTLTALERWVENGTAPEGIVATKYMNDDSTQPVQRTMPLCSFPTQAHYSGSGDVNSASNWSCAANNDLLHVGLDGALAGLIGPERQR